MKQNVRIYNSKIEKYSYVARNSLIQNTDIGKFCSISEYCNIGMPSHPIHMISTSPLFLKGNNFFKKNFASIDYNNSKKTVIKNDVWIGANVLIKDGITIDNGAIIGAGAVVTKNVPAYAIVAGVPAKIISFRFEVDERNKLLDSEWWNFDEKKISKINNNFVSMEQFLNSLNTLIY